METTTVKPRGKRASARDVREAWARTRLRIIDKGGQLVPYQRNDAQVVLSMAQEAQGAQGLPVRVMVLKARQRGITTGVSADFYSRVYLQPRTYAAVAAHKHESSQIIFEMVRRFHDELPEAERRPTDYSNRREVCYSAPHGSWFRVFTAGSESLGRGLTIHHFHGSEVAFWPHAKATLAAILQCVPDRAGTSVVLETTANGVGGEFYDRWWAAEERMAANPMDLDGYIPVFLTWLDEPEYRRAVPRGYEWGALDDDERALQALGADDEQLFWRRWMIAETFGGDVGLFKQEYPSTPEEAFQASGRPAIAPAIITYHRSTVEPYRKANLIPDPNVVGGIRAEYGEHILEPCWHIWRPPSETADYVVGGDVAEGEVSDRSDASSEPDYSAAIALDRQNLEQVAEWRGQIPADLFGIEMLKAAWFYNKGWASPEANAAGQAAVAKFRQHNYARTYRRQQDDIRLAVQEVAQLGWKTTLANRKRMIDDFLELARPDVFGGFEGQLIIHSERIIAEERTFIWTETGRREHRPGAHDDLLFALFIALQVHKRCPRTYGTYHPVIPASRHKPVAELAYVNAVDWGPVAEDGGPRPQSTG